MLSLDLRSILVATLLASCLKGLLVFGAWREARGRYDGLGLWVCSAAASGLGLVLLGLRDLAPDWLSIVLANAMLLCAIFLHRAGLARFFGMSGGWAWPCALLAAFSAIHGYYTYIEPSLYMRFMNAWIWSSLATLQIAWLLGRKIEVTMRADVRWLQRCALAFSATGGAVSIWLVAQPRERFDQFDFSHPGAVPIAAFLLSELLRVLFTFALVLLVQKRMEADLVLEHSKFSAAFDESPYATALVRISDGRFMEVNAMFTRMFGHQRDEVIGRTSIEVGLWTNPDERADINRVLLAEGFVSERAVELATRSGQRLVAGMTSKLLVVNGHSCAMSHLQDLTQRKADEEELVAYRSRLERLVEDRTVALSIAKEDAESSDRAKTAFLATVSHELRTPLNAIIGMTELARHAADEPAQNERLAVVAEAADNLLAVVKNMLDVAQIEANKLSLEKAVFTLRDVDQMLHALHGPAMRERGLDFAVEFPAGHIDLPVVGDRSRLGQVLNILIGNALKYTHAGSVTVRGGTVADEGGGIFLALQVIDTGIGIADADRHRLFLPFNQLDNTLTRKQGGAGLGLAIAKRLVEMMGGGIDLESRPGSGSAFRFTVRLAKAGEAADSRRSASSSPVERRTETPDTLTRLHGSRVLVAEDDRLSRLSARAMLENLGLEVDFALNGREAVEMVQRSAYDLVLMDIHMPEMDGFAATRAIRSLASLEKLPILALTGNAFESDRVRCLEAGMNDHISKPVYTAVLLAALTRWLPDRRMAGRT